MQLKTWTVTENVDGQEVVKTMANPADLLLWNENPRGIKEDDYKALGEKLEKYGALKPLLLNTGKNYGTPNGLIGGNMRLRKFLEKQKKEVWIEWRSPKDETEFLELAVLDNTEYGYWEPDLLAQLLQKNNSGQLEGLKLQLAHPVLVRSLLDSYRPSTTPQPIQKDTSSVKDKLQTYLNNTIKQIVLFFTDADYQNILDRLDVAGTELGTKDNNTKTVVALLEFYENNK